MNKLKQIREAAGITQAELAKLTGISVRVIQNYEQGTRPLNGARAITVKHIADALGCRMEDLIEEQKKRAKNGPFIFDLSDFFIKKV